MVYSSLKACGRLPIHHNGTFVAICYDWDIISRNLLKSAFLKGWWVTFGQYFRWKGTIFRNPRWTGKTRDIPVSYGVEILTDDYFVLSQDGWTDRRMELW